MEKGYLSDQNINDSWSNLLIDSQEGIICNEENEEEYEKLMALEQESWMTRKAEIIYVRIKCDMDGTEILGDCMQYLQELQNDGYIHCEPYYDDCGYVYFNRRIET